MKKTNGKEETKIITRFAPSPTGNLHIGSVRTALFNWVYARSLRGKFLLRIEDTDAIRSKEEYLDSIIDGLSWLGIDYDGIVFQSKNSERHIQVAEEMLSKGLAYKDKDGCVRVKFTSDGSISFNDKVYGFIEVNNDKNEDFVLLRSNGTPTYMLAVVVDDHDMEITHVIRGSDHITNTIKQIFIYQSLGWKIPEFCHIPLIHDEDGSKLSKRKCAVDVSSYKEQGFLSESVISYLIRLGWSCDSDEVLSIDRIISMFSLDNIGKSPAKFDINKFRSINSYFLNSIPLEKLLLYIKEYVEVYGCYNWYKELFESESDIDSGVIHDDKKDKKSKKLAIVKLLEIYVSRVYTINELLTSIEFFGNENVNKDMSINNVNDNLKKWIDVDVISSLYKNLNQIACDEWNESNIEVQIDNTLKTLKSSASSLEDEKVYAKRDLFMALRVSILQSDVSPSIVKICSIVGKDFALDKLIYI